MLPTLALKEKRSKRQCLNRANNVASPNWITPLLGSDLFTYSNFIVISHSANQKWRCPTNQGCWQFLWAGGLVASSTTVGADDAGGLVASSTTIGADDAGGLVASSNAAVSVQPGSGRSYEFQLKSASAAMRFRGTVEVDSLRSRTPAATTTS